MDSALRPVIILPVWKINLIFCAFAIIWFKLYSFYIHLSITLENKSILVSEPGFLTNYPYMGPRTHGIEIIFCCNVSCRYICSTCRDLHNWKLYSSEVAFFCHMHGRILPLKCAIIHFTEIIMLCQTGGLLSKRWWVVLVLQASNHYQNQCRSISVEPNGATWLELVKTATVKNYEMVKRYLFKRDLCNSMQVNGWRLNAYVRSRIDEMKRYTKLPIFYHFSTRSWYS